jgi:hypothetical protein
MESLTYTVYQVCEKHGDHEIDGNDEGDVSEGLKDIADT